jgi:signal transduction histidine kinase
MLIAASIGLGIVSTSISIQRNETFNTVSNINKKIQDNSTNKDSIVQSLYLIRELESKQRGYLLSKGNQYFLTGYKENSARLRQLQSKLLTLLPEYAKATNPLYNAKLAEMNQTIQLINSGKPDQALNLYLSLKGVKILDQIILESEEQINLLEKNISTLRSKEAELKSKFENLFNSLRIIQFLSIALLFTTCCIVIYSLIQERRRIGKALISSQSEADTLKIRSKQQEAMLDEFQKQLDAYKAKNSLKRWIDASPVLYILDVSHSLKNEITVIQSSAELIERIAIKNSSILPIVTQNKIQKFCNKIYESNTKILSLVQSGISVIKAGGEIEKVPIDLLKTVDNAIKSWEIVAVNKQQQIELTATGSRKANEWIVSADKMLLTSIIDNLLSNAIKYSPASTKIEIKISENGQEIILAIQDSGQGINSSELPKIFDMFYRVESQVNQVEGTGIGLATVKHAINALGWKIQVTSEMGRGTRFEVFIS